jgi:hypothetical protein
MICHINIYQQETLIKETTIVKTYNKEENRIILICIKLPKRIMTQIICSTIKKENQVPQRTINRKNKEDYKTLQSKSMKT